MGNHLFFMAWADRNKQPKLKIVDIFSIFLFKEKIKYLFLDTFYLSQYESNYFE